MEHDKYNLLLSILREYYGQQQGGAASKPEIMEGELALLLSALVGSGPNQQTPVHTGHSTEHFFQDKIAPYPIDPGMQVRPGYVREIREPLPGPAEACGLRLNYIVERAFRDRAAAFFSRNSSSGHGMTPKISPKPSTGDISMEYGDNSDGSLDDLKRKRNREAQKRFRDRQKRIRNSLESEYFDLCQTADLLEEENIALEQRLYLEMKNIIVSEIILLAFEGKYLNGKSILSRVLPEIREEKRGQKHSEEEEDGIAQNCLALTQVTGASDEKSLEKVINRKLSPDVERIYNEAYDLPDPDSLYLYYREWQIEAKHLYARSSQREDSEADQLMIGKMDELYRVWLVNLYLYPDVFTKVLSDHLVPAEQSERLWSFVAEMLYKNMKKEQIQRLQKEYKQYLDDSARCDQDIQRAWRKLAEIEQNFKVASRTTRGGSMWHLKVVSQATACKSLAQKSWDNVTGFACRFMESIGHRNAFLCNTFASPYAVDWIDITKRLLYMSENDNLECSSG